MPIYLTIAVRLRNKAKEGTKKVRATRSETVCPCVDNVIIGLAILDALEPETRIARLGQMNKCCRILEDYRAIMMVERVEQFDAFSFLLRFARALCLHGFRHESEKQFPDDEHAPVVATDHFNHVLVVTGAVPRAFLAEYREICRSLMESTECSESKSDLGSGIIDAACLFCVAGSDWWVNYQNLLVDVGLRHEIDEARDTTLVMVFQPLSLLLVEREK